MLNRTLQILRPLVAAWRLNRLFRPRAMALRRSPVACEPVRRDGSDCLRGPVITVPAAGMLPSHAAPVCVRLGPVQRGVCERIGHAIAAIEWFAGAGALNSRAGAGMAAMRRNPDFRPLELRNPELRGLALRRDLRAAEDCRDTLRPAISVDAGFLALAAKYTPATSVFSAGFELR